MIDINKFKGINHGNGLVDLRYLTLSMELRPVEIHLKEDACFGSKPGFVIVLVAPFHTEELMKIYGQISLEMFNEGLAEVGYEIVKKK